MNNYPYPKGTIVYFLNKDAVSFIEDIKKLIDKPFQDISLQKWIYRIRDLQFNLGSNKLIFISAVWQKGECSINEIRLALTYDNQTQFYNINRFEDKLIYDYIIKNYKAIEFDMPWNGFDLVEYYGDEIEWLKTDFSDRVYEGDFVRLSYEFWCKIFHKDVDKIIVYFEPQDNALTLELRDTGDNKVHDLIYLPFVTEWSLGRFLYEQNFVDWDITPNEDMTTLNSACNYYNTDSTINSSVNACYYDSLTSSGIYPDHSNKSDIYVSIDGANRSVSNLVDTIDETKQRVEKLKKKIEDNGSLYQEKPNYMKENNTMTITKNDNFAKSLNLDFGTCEKDKVKMSPYGLAVKNANNTWVSYDPKSESIMDVEILNFDCGKFLFKMPVAIADVKAGDVVIHNRVPMFVKSADKGTIKAVDIISGSVQDILPTKNMFGFNFVTKVVSLIDFSKSGANADNPFGNILPFMLLADGNENGSDLLPLLLMNNGAKGIDMSNPLILYALCGSGSKGSDILPVMLLAQSMNANATPKTTN